MILPEELARIESLRPLGEAHLNQIARLAQLKEADEGTVLFRETEDSDCIYFVLSGKVSLSVSVPDGDPVEIFAAGPGDLIGWTPVLGRRAMTATARAATRCRLAVLDAARVQALCEQDPHFGVAFLRQVALVLSGRLGATRRRLAHSATRRLPLGATVEGSD
jgi:CRP-like cAMP-binding protein